jgi:hypothetical protein
MNRPCPRDSAPVRAHVTVRLRILGNGVAPRQGAAAALQLLIATAAAYPGIPQPSRPGSHHTRAAA